MRFLVGLLLAASTFACAEVKPWQRGLLAHSSMDPASSARGMREEFVRHTFDVREGATGGYGTVGGGCGCN